MVKISTIMPIYNMQDYVSDAIYAWEEQTLKDKQLICIDDSSNDDTLRIVEALADRYDNIKVIALEKNGGAGPARNRGIAEADGEYISFLDADDSFSDVNALERLFAAAEAGECDTCGGMVSERVKEKIIPYQRFRNLEFEGTDFCDLSYRDFQDDYYYQGFIYKKTYLDGNDMAFPDLRRVQDPPFFAKAMLYANTVRVVNVEYYLHTIGHKTVSYDQKTICDSFKGFLMNIELADENDLPVLLRRSANRINRTCLHLWKGILDKECIEFWDMAHRAKSILVKYGMDVDILGYYPYLQNKSDLFDEYTTYVRIKGIFKHEDNVVLHGAGINGRKIYRYMTDNKICNVVSWLDRKRFGEVIEGVTISEVNKIRDLVYDHVLITPCDRQMIEEMKEELLNYGVEEKLIIEWINL